MGIGFRCIWFGCVGFVVCFGFYIPRDLNSLYNFHGIAGKKMTQVLFFLVYLLTFFLTCLLTFLQVVGLSGLDWTSQLSVRNKWALLHLFCLSSEWLFPRLLRAAVRAAFCLEFFAISLRCSTERTLSDRFFHALLGSFWFHRFVTVIHVIRCLCQGGTFLCR